jgi:hypothetical protein
MVACRTRTRNREWCSLVLPNIVSAILGLPIGRWRISRLALRMASEKALGDLHGALASGEGAAQRSGKRMRVNVQLIDAETGSHLWAERFDKPLADLFDMQDEIVARLANALNAQLVAAEARRAEQAPNPDSMDLYFQGMAWFNKGLRPDTLARARGFLRQGRRVVGAVAARIDLVEIERA